MRLLAAAMGMLKAMFAAGVIKYFACSQWVFNAGQSSIFNPRFMRPAVFAEGTTSWLAGLNLQS